MNPFTPNPKKILVAMSGGVDSSVAAALLKQQGHEVVGCFMRLGSDDSVEKLNDCLLPDSSHSPPAAHHHGCCSLNDAADARLVAAILDVPFYVLNFKKDFGRIIDYFVSEYNAGRTPNPCVRCNDWLKFGKLWDYARSISADLVATGHYARIAPDPDTNQLALLRGADASKDQSYVLFGTPRDHLRHMTLPIGHLQKSRVRQIAQKLNLPVFDKPDSQEICFVPDNDYAALVRRHTPDQVRPGNIIDDQGRVLGAHPGHQTFTIGQRRGLGVSADRPLYVLDRDPAANTVTVGPRQDLDCATLTADQTNWLIDPPPPGTPIRCQAKIRYNTPPAPATLQQTGDDTLISVTFDLPQSAVSPGQAVVCYHDDRLIAGGWIKSATRIQSQTPIALSHQTS